MLPSHTLRRPRPTRRSRTVLPLLAGALVLTAFGSAPTAEARTVAEPGLHQERSAAVTLTGPWTDSTTPTASGGAYASLAVPGSASITFDATGVSWIARRNAYAGTARVYLDGRRVKTVDLYAKETQYRKTVYAVSGLPLGEHTLKIVRTGKKNAASHGRNLILDAFRILDITPPDRPDSLAARPIRTGAELTWRQSATADLAGFRIYRQTGSGAARLVATTGPGTTTFRDVGLADASQWRYTIKAFDRVGNASAASDAAGHQSPTPVSYAAYRFDACPAATVTVATWQELKAAADTAQPGTVIRLQPGTYTLPWALKLSARGTADQPVWICGPRSAIIQGAGVHASGGIQINDSVHLRLAGFTVRESQKGVSVLNSRAIALADLLVEQTGDEGVHLKVDTTASVVVHNTIRHTGRATPKYGEGVYIGSSVANWCALTACRPDASDDNAIVDNTISATAAEPIDVKEGAIGGVISGNIIDGTGMTSGGTLISIQSNDWVVAHNWGANPPKDGIQVWQVLDIWGRDNTVYANTISGRVPGYAVRLAYNDLNNVVGCDTVADTSALGLSNKPCQL